MSKSTLWFNKSIHECTTPHQIGDSITHRVIDEELRQLLIEYIQRDVVNMPYAMQDKPGQTQRRFAGAQPVTILRQKKHELLKGEHLHSEKIDGVRYLMLGVRLCSDRWLNQNAAIEAGLSRADTDQNVPESDQVLQLAPKKKEYMTKQKQAHKERERNFRELVSKAAEETGFNSTISTTEEVIEDELANENSSQESSVRSSTSTTTRKYKRKRSTESTQGDSSDSDDDSIEDDEVVTTEVFKKRVRRVVQIQHLLALVDRNNEIYVLSGVQLPERVFPFLLDGELAKHLPTQTHHYLVMNLIMSNGYSWKRWAYQERVAAYNKLVTFFRVESGCCFSQVVAKKQQFWYQFDEVRKRYKSGEYRCDGIISTVNRSRAVEFGTDRDSYKFKDIHTFDLRVELDREVPGNVILSIGGHLDLTGRLRDPSILSVEQQQPANLLFDGLNPVYEPDWNHVPGGFVICECVWLPERTHAPYRAVMIRADKSHPNNAAVVNMTKKNVNEGMTPDEIYKLWKQDRQATLDRACTENIQQDLMRYRSVLMYDRPAHPENYLEHVLKNSNWDVRKMHNNDLSNELSTSQLSWLSNDENVAPNNSLKTPEQNHIGWSMHVEKLLNTTALKPVVKAKRGRGGTKKGKRKASTKPKKIKEPKQTTKRRKTSKKEVEVEIEADSDPEEEDEIEEEEEEEIDDEDEQEDKMIVEEEEEEEESIPVEDELVDDEEEEEEEEEEENMQDEEEYVEEDSDHETVQEFTERLTSSIARFNRKKT